jgi:hypothetical protein
VLGGVGRTNADVSLSASYSATIDCTNHGGSLVESHTSNFAADSSATATSTKNGQLSVPAQSVSGLSSGAADLSESELDALDSRGDCDAQQLHVHAHLRRLLVGLHHHQRLTGKLVKALDPSRLGGAVRVPASLPAVTRPR